MRGLLSYTSGVKSIAGTGVVPDSPPSNFAGIRTFERGCRPIVAGIDNRHLDFFTAAAATPIADVLLSVEVRDFEEKQSLVERRSGPGDRCDPFRLW
jgi:hypothetical protein